MCHFTTKGKHFFFPVSQSLCSGLTSSYKPGLVRSDEGCADERKKHVWNCFALVCLSFLCRKEFGADEHGGGVAGLFQDWIGFDL